MILNESDIIRLWSKITKRGHNECWPWHAKAKLSYGYGVLNIWVDEGRRRNVVASRIVCFLNYGPPPFDGAKALHSCDNPPCCNPKHLRWGTQQQNVADAVFRNRNSKPPVNYPGRHVGKMPKGHAAWNSSLDEARVRDIWRLHLLGGITIADIARMTGATKYAVTDLCRGKSWQHLDNAPTIEQLKKGGVRRGHNQFTGSGESA